MKMISKIYFETLKKSFWFQDGFLRSFYHF